MADNNQIILELKAKTAKLEASLKRVKDKVDKTEKGFGGLRISTAKLRRNIGALRNNMLLVSFALGGTAASISKLIKAYGKQELAEKKLQAALKSTGHAAGMSADEFKTMASSLQESTTFGDEAILGAQSLMLTFTKVGKEVMPEAIETVLNMSEAMGTGLKESTVQLGKALNDPIQGISALSRVGVQLSDDQKAQIKSFMEVNDVASAQKVILGELETQFGGMAEAASNTMTGAMQQASNAMGDTAESMGNLLAPATIIFSRSIKDAAEGWTDFFAEIKETEMETAVRQLKEMGTAAEDLALLEQFVLMEKHSDALINNNKKIIEAVHDQNTLYGNRASLSDDELIFLGATIIQREREKNILSSGQIVRERQVVLTEQERVNQENVLHLINKIKKENKDIIKDKESLSDQDKIDIKANALKIEDLTHILMLIRQQESARKALSEVGKEDTGGGGGTAPPEEDTEAWDKFLEKQKAIIDTDEEFTLMMAEKHIAYALEQELLAEWIKNNKTLAESMGIVTDAQKKQQDAEKETEKSRKRQRQQVAKDSMEIGKMAMKDSDAAKNAAIDKISSYAMSAAAKQMEKIISSVPFPFNIPLAAAGGLAIGAAVGGLADNLKKAQYGMNEVVDEPTLILAGEAGAEQVSITPLESPNIEGVQGEGASVVVNVSGNVLTSDFVEGELADNIREAVRRGTDFGIG